MTAAPARKAEKIRPGRIGTLRLNTGEELCVIYAEINEGGATQGELRKLNPGGGLPEVLACGETIGEMGPAVNGLQMSTFTAYARKCVFTAEQVHACGNGRLELRIFTDAER